VEVKSSRSPGLGHPEERIQTTKKTRLSRAARHYIFHHARGKLEYRFDVIAVVLNPDEPEIHHLENAFEV
jgi:Holliday junction resolvase-like predicted endonuclease